MQTFSTPESLRSYIYDQRIQRKTIGLVPTMGALHQGHMELVSASLKSDNLTICSIYINPVQFNDKQDLINYPREIEQDLKKLQTHGCQVVFCPSDEVMYPNEPKLAIEFAGLENIMEGGYRPDHFKGVALVVSKLFHMTQPDRAYFGEKDWQQLVIIRQLVRDLSFPLEIVGVPIVREADGLAMSSRNQRLSHQHRAVANELFKALSMVKNELENGTAIETARANGMEYLKQYSLIVVEYLEIVQSYTLERPNYDLGKEPLSICIAAFLGNVRLIDNLQVFKNQPYQ